MSTLISNQCDIFELERIMNYKTHVEVIKNFCEEYNFFAFRDNSYRLYIDENNFIEILIETETNYNYFEVIYRYEINNDLINVHKKIMTSKRINFVCINKNDIKEHIYNILRETIISLISSVYKTIVFKGILKNPIETPNEIAHVFV
jgi:hypothetical protein